MANRNSQLSVLARALSLLLGVGLIVGGLIYSTGWIGTSLLLLGFGGVIASLRQVTLIHPLLEMVTVSRE